VKTESDILAQRVGTTLRGKWKLERLLGVGGMAAVYVGLHKIGRRDAIKILHHEIAENKDLAARFEQEAHAVNRFRHPGAVEILDIDVTEDGAPFMVMELLEGESIEDRIQRQLIGVGETLRIADELLDVLAAAHDHGIVHRDIKPDNLFLLHDGRLKVLDFGIARMRQGAPKTFYTQAGVAIGTLSYMPPEQVAGAEIDGRADLFAVGCTLFRIVTGRSPHEGDTELELMVKMAMEPAPPLASLSPTLPRELCMVIDRALAFERERRYPDARTMQQDVRAVRAGRFPPHASARLAAGDLPNPSKTEDTAAVSGARSAALAMTAASPAMAPVTRVPLAATAPSMPMFTGATMAGAGASLSAMAPSVPVLASTAVFGAPAAFSAMPPSVPASWAAPASVNARAGYGAPPKTLIGLHGPSRSSKGRDSTIALLVIGGMIAALVVAVTIWWSGRSSAEDVAQAGARPLAPRAAVTPTPTSATPTPIAATPTAIAVEPPAPVGPVVKAPVASPASAAANPPVPVTTPSIPTLPTLPPPPVLPPPSSLPPPVSLPTLTLPQIPPPQLPSPQIPPPQLPSPPPPPALPPRRRVPRN
jgi:eukaryotic-like serine/threonine-protein kinase